MTKAEILAALSKDYKRALSVYNSMEKQAAAALAKGDTTGYENMKKCASARAFTLSGIKRAAMVLGIEEIKFMEAVEQLLNA